PGQELGGIRSLGEPSATADRRPQGARAQGADVEEIAAPRPLAETDDRGRFDCGRESTERRTDRASLLAQVTTTQQARSGASDPARSTRDPQALSRTGP